jgi:NADPH:quinone reductase-like Zn-dependent oxidoreductase
MKSAQITRYGNTSEAIKNNQKNAPNLSCGKVLVNVLVAGINLIDRKIREGYMQQTIHLQFPSTLGMDFSGIIEQVEEEISSDFKQGDEVYGQAGIPSGGSGAFAEQALASVTILHINLRL